MDDFIQRPERSEPFTTNSEANSNTMNKKTIGAFCTRNNCLRSEVLLTLKVVNLITHFIVAMTCKNCFPKCSWIPKLQNSVLVAKRSVHIYVILVLHHILNSC